MLPKILFKTKFTIEYDKENIDYYSKDDLAIKLFENLLKASENRCMYCGENLEGLSVEFKTFGLKGIKFDREHTVERKMLSKICMEKLTKCKFNFGVACHNCNSKKSHGVKVAKTLLIKLANKTCESECNVVCSEYTDVLNDYRKNNLIIAMPAGLKEEYNEDIVYNTENLIFQLNEENTYIEEEKRIIYNHIEKFLSHFQTECLDDLITHFCENGLTILPAKKTLFNKNRFKSIVSDNFIDFLSDKNENQRKIIIDKIKNKMIRSQGILIS